jgi:hypothetical protein
MSIQVSIFIKKVQMLNDDLTMLVSLLSLALMIDEIQCVSLRRQSKDNILLCRIPI